MPRTLTAGTYRDLLRVMLRFVLASGLVLVLSACGGSAKPAGSAEPATEEASSDPATASAEKTETANPGAGNAAEADATKIPTECTAAGDVCVPPKAFVDKLCQDVYSGVALVMFRKGTPWTRAYMTRKTEAWNASGGASVAGWLEFDEEVLILKHRAAPKGGMQVSGAGGGYEALRLNGACVTLSGEEVTLKTPPKAKYPKLEWRWIDDSIREKLKEDPEIAETDQVRRKECKGVTMGAVSDKCEKADKKLSDLVAKYVANGGDLPNPDKMPQ